MESLGGDQEFWVRFVAQHSAIVYFMILCALFAISPSLSYRFSELLETHAVNTYSVFLDNNEDLLKELPPSVTAVDYYTLGSSDPFYAEFQTAALASGNDVSVGLTPQLSLFHASNLYYHRFDDPVTKCTTCTTSSPQSALMKQTMSAPW